MTDYNLDADKEAKEKMMWEMLNDLPVLLTERLLHEVCDQLIRKGWRKANHIAEAGKMVMRGN